MSIVTPPAETESSGFRVCPPPFTANRHDVSMITPRMVATSSVEEGWTQQAECVSCCFASQRVTFALPREYASGPKIFDKWEHYIYFRKLLAIIIGVRTAWTHSGTTEAFPWLTTAVPRAMAGPTLRNAVTKAGLIPAIDIWIQLLLVLVFQ